MSSPNQSPCNPPPLPDLHSNNNIVVHHDPPENPIISINPIMTHKINPAPFKKLSGAVKYMECLKNHAAAIGGNATDGCGEFMAGGEEGTLEALKCSACNCHRNFHRKIHIQPPPPPLVNINKINNVASINYSGGAGSSEMKKRFRTKFSQEQKEKMLGFAERAGWKIQKLDDSEVRRFCQEIGIKRKVLKVWMHNNKYHLANKTDAN